MKIRDLLFKNFGWKVGALILSLALWFHIATEKIYEKQFPVALHVIQVPSSLRVEQIDPSRLQLSFIGTGKQLLQLMLHQQIVINVDLSNVNRPGDYEFVLSPSELADVDVAAFRNVTFLNGNRIRISLEPKS